MRALLASILCLLLIVGIWLYFTHSTGQLLAELETLTELRPLPEEELLLCWEKLRFRYSVFSDSSRLDEASAALSRALVLFRHEDEGAAEAELTAFRDQLHFMRNQERLSIENII